MSKIKLYSKTVCPYCIRAKKLLDSKKILYVEENLDEDPDLFLRLKERTGWMTVPMIFFGENLIGGYNELVQALENGELERQLKS